MKTITALFAVLAIPCISTAQNTTDAALVPPDIAYNPGIASILFKLFISLVIIIGLIYGSIFLLKKFTNKTSPASDQLIKVIGKSYLAPKQSLYIVKMGLTYAVLGVCENSVNLLKELSPEEVESIKQPSQKSNGFQNVLKSVLKR